MTGREIADICSEHERCKGCELEDSRMCRAVMCDMEDGTPSEIYKILERYYGGD